MNHEPALPGTDQHPNLCASPHAHFDPTFPHIPKYLTLAADPKSDKINARMNT